MSQARKWWKEAVVYQIYPRSFKDANGDGIGDLQGIISQLDYLKALGIDVIWLSPFYQSPNADNGYDISDYRAIMSDFGTMADFEELLYQVHQRGLKMVVDLVVNHSSDEHFWFREALKGKDNPYRDYYIWRPARRGGRLPNDWLSFFSGSAWELDEASNEYYLHLFAKKQPDLNWENPQLRAEIHEIMRFWLDKGVDGFRMDVVAFFSKNQKFPKYPKDHFGDFSEYANGPRIHEFLQEMNQEVLSKYDIMTVGEAFGVGVEQALDYVSEHRNELQMIFHFDHAVPRTEQHFINPAPELKLTELKAIFRKWDTALSNDGWNSIYWGNHDSPRVLSRFGNTSKYEQESAKMLATILLTLRGTAYIYQGDEIGMSNCYFGNIDEFDDIQVKNAYQIQVLEKGENAQKFIRVSNKIARDHARTPMQWSAQLHAGFSESKSTWLKVNPNYQRINVQAQQNDPNSIWHYYRALIQLRKQHLGLVYGTYRDLRPNCNKIYAYKRLWEHRQYLILNNWTNQEQTFSVKYKGSQLILLLSNYNNTAIYQSKEFTLKPYESRIYEVEV